MPRYGIGPESAYLAEKLKIMNPIDCYPFCESHVHVSCDGLTLCLDGCPDHPASSLPAFYHAGICSIFYLLAQQFPALTCISLLGILDTREEAAFTAFDLWVQIEDEGFYLPMAYAASLFRDNGIPYFHEPLPYPG